MRRIALFEENDERSVCVALAPGKSGGKKSVLVSNAWCEVCVAKGSRDSERHERRDALFALVSFVFTNIGIGHQPNCHMLRHFVGVASWSHAPLFLITQGKRRISVKKCTGSISCDITDDFNIFPSYSIPFGLQPCSVVAQQVSCWNQKQTVFKVATDRPYQRKWHI